MEDDWVGKAVSIECDEKLGVFQGVIKEISESQLTIIRAFRNGVPLRKQDAEVKLRVTDILKIDLIPSFVGLTSVAPCEINNPTPVKQPNFASTNITEQLPPASLIPPPNPFNSTNDLSNKFSILQIDSEPPKPRPLTFPQSDSSNFNFDNSKIGKSPSPSVFNSSVTQFFGNLVPAKVEERLATACIGNIKTGDFYDSSKPINIANRRSPGSNPNSFKDSYSNGYGNGKPKNNFNFNGGNVINGYANGNNGYALGYNKRNQRKQLRRENSIKQTFGTSVDDPELHEDFDFEGNLALFDKQAIWDVIEASGKTTDQQQNQQQERPVSFSDGQKYRHDENILASGPLELRQIRSVFDNSEEFVTDEGLIIPTIPFYVRAKIEITAEKAGLTFQRQCDILGRGTADLAILLLGGARRLTPNNCHQWPVIAILCEKSISYRSSNIGAAIGRQLASHGIKVLLYLEEDPIIENKSNEISLYSATGNAITYFVNELPTPDLVILSTNTSNLSIDVKKWLNDNRASILAVDPPTGGINDVHIKYAILPILPLNGISANKFGKLYLCNLGIPDKFYRDAGIKYKSPFGHKFVIPIHLKD